MWKLFHFRSKLRFQRARARACSTGFAPGLVMLSTTTTGCRPRQASSEYTTSPNSCTLSPPITLPNYDQPAMMADGGSSSKHERSSGYQNIEIWWQKVTSIYEETKIWRGFTPPPPPDVRVFLRSWCVLPGFNSRARARVFYSQHGDDFSTPGRFWNVNKQNYFVMCLAVAPEVDSCAWARMSCVVYA